MDNDQHGLSNGQSTINEVTKFVYGIIHVLDLGGYKMFIILDYSNACDTLGHILLGIRLSHFGVCADPLE